MLIHKVIALVFFILVRFQTLNLLAQSFKMAFQKERQINAKLQGRKRLISIYFYDSKTNIKRE